MVTSMTRPSDAAAQQHSSGEKQDVSRPRIHLSNLKKVHLKDYAIRFAFGGAVSVIAALIGKWTNVPFGGMFTAFPAILLASLTLIGKHDGDEKSAEDAEGGVLGAIAFIVAAIFISRTVTVMTGAVSLLLALAVWLALAVSLYLLAIRLGFLRTYERQDDDTSP